MNSEINGGVKAAEGNPTDAQNFALWQRELAEIAEKSPSWILRKWKPRLDFSKPPHLASIEANTSLRTVFINPTAMRCTQEIRRYLLAHELGHLEGWHSTITVSAVIVATVAIARVLVCAYTGQWLSTASYALLFVLCIVVLWLYAKTMRFEWDADRRGARMLGSSEMLDGMDLIAATRLPSQEPYYECKRSRLQGSPTSRFGTAERKSGGSPGGVAVGS